MISSNPIVQDFLEICASKGVRQFVFSPGSRNAPLAISLFNDNRFGCRVVADERSAGFIALGMALQSGETVGVCCTSGSAVLNYAPAIAEAYYQNVPLLVVSADRPEELINQGEGQSIVQPDVFKNIINASYHLPLETSSESEEARVQMELNEAIDKTHFPFKGPVHLNMQFAEPFYGTVEQSVRKTEITNSNKETNGLEESLKNTLLSDWNKAGKKLILCGQMDKDDKLSNILEQLSEDKSVVVLVENTSNLVHKNFCHCIDRLITSIKPEELEQFKPDLLLTIGGAIISKKIKVLLRSLDIPTHWDVTESRMHYDTFQKLTRPLTVSPKTLFKELLKQERNSSSGYFSLWKTRDYLTQDKHFNYLNEALYSDLKVFDLIQDSIPDNTVLHMANSSVVRYMQLFDPQKNILYQSNRGVSGIDGSTSTALGYSLLSDKVNVLLTGDISFFYDSNALWNKYLHSKFKIILINNGGGGIFRFIQGPSSTNILEDFFEAGQDLSADKICETFGVKYYQSNNLEDLEDSLRDLLLFDESPALLEIKTPSELNPEVLQNYFKTLQ